MAQYRILEHGAVATAEPVWGHQPVSPPRSSWLQAIDAHALPTRYCRGQIIYQEAAPVECWYRVVSGIARRSNVRPDGRRQIIDLLLPGDVFGFGARGTHAFAAEAISNGTIVARYPRARLEGLAMSDPKIARALQEMALEESRRLQDLILILGLTTAQEKVAAFLGHLADRLAGRPADRMTLPISRYDIADYLALSVETVSRALTGLRRSGAIALTGSRQVRIVARETFDRNSPFESAAPRLRTDQPGSASHARRFALS